MTKTPPTNREMFAMFFGAMQYIHQIPNERKTELILDISKKMLGMEQKEVMDLMQSLDGTLDYLTTKTMKGDYHKEQETGI